MGLRPLWLVLALMARTVVAGPATWLAPLHGWPSHLASGAEPGPQLVGPQMEPYYRAADSAQIPAKSALFCTLVYYDPRLARPGGATLWVVGPKRANKDGLENPKACF